MTCIVYKLYISAANTAHVRGRHDDGNCHAGAFSSAMEAQ